MNVRAHIERLEKAATAEVLRQLTLELGGSLPRLRRRELGELETALAKAVVPKGARDAAVMRKTLSVLISGALERGARTAQHVRELEVVARGLKPVWRRILAAVDPESVFRPKDLRVRADTATRELAKMEERGLIEEIPAGESLLADQRGKYLRLTPFGEEVQRRVLETAPRRRKRPSAQGAQLDPVKADVERRVSEAQRHEIPIDLHAPPRWDRESRRDHAPTATPPEHIVPDERLTPDAGEEAHDRSPSV